MRLLERVALRGNGSVEGAILGGVKSRLCVEYERDNAGSVVELGGAYKGDVRGWRECEQWLYGKR